MIKSNIPFIFVLTGVWLVLLGLCALIEVLIVPVSPPFDVPFIEFIIGAGKVGISLLVILLWLLGWYKMMEVLLNVEFYMAENTTSRDD